MSESEEHEARHLVDVSKGEVGPANGPRVQGVVAISANGSHVYFVAKGKLTGADTIAGRAPETAEPMEGAYNLYDYSEGHLRFVADFAPSDNFLQGSVGQWERGTLIANVTPNGRFLVFKSHGALTPDDTRSEGPSQVYEYDSQAATLKRVSVGDQGFNDNGNSGTGNAVIVGPEKALGAATVPIRSDPSMSDDGSFVFFESPAALAPGALNDVKNGESFKREGLEGLAENIYEYHDGHVSLISDGRDTTPESKLLISPVQLYGTDISGANVFFSTLDQLVPEDTDTQRDYYDARVGGGFPAPVSSTPCEAACHPSGAGAGPEAAPASESFAGPGNLAAPGAGTAASVAKPKPLTRAQKLAKALKACRKDKKKPGRTRCEKQARKSYGVAAKARRSTRASKRGRAAR